MSFCACWLVVLGDIPRVYVTGWLNMGEHGSRWTWVIPHSTCNLHTSACKTQCHALNLWEGSVLVHLTWCNHINACRSRKDSCLMRVKLHKRYLIFFNSSCKSNNTMMSQIVINGSGSAACRSVNFICSIYDLSKYDISLSLLSKLKDNDEECAI